MQGTGYCECGCGELAPIAKRSTTAKGVVKGQPQRYIAGHHLRTEFQVVMYGHKLCSICLWSKPLGEFHKMRRPSGRAAECKDCRKTMPSQSGEKRRTSSREWYRRNRDAQAAKRYGMTVDEFQALLKAQDGCCAICGEPETRMRRGYPMQLVIDHCHQSGQVRGLLCSSCNTGIGLLRHDADVLERARTYLQEG